jgi:hypothetical protein
VEVPFAGDWLLHLAKILQETLKMVKFILFKKVLVAVSLFYQGRRIFELGVSMFFNHIENLELS